MLEYIILGIIQGMAEWLPVSSGGVLALVQTIFFGKRGFEELIKQALFLHLGTFFAALVYFRKDIWRSLRFTGNDRENKKLFNFLLISTIITGILGYGLLNIFINLQDQVEFSGRIITLIIGILLLVTAFLQIKVKNRGDKNISDLNTGDSFLLGIMQGLAALPGLSRSGLTVSSLLLRNFNGRDALKLSFLMSMPVVLGGNIILNLSYIMRSDFVEIRSLLIGLIFSFIFGLLTIDILLKIAKKINFGYFVLFFGFLIIISVLI